MYFKKLILDSSWVRAWCRLKFATTAYRKQTSIALSLLWLYMTLHLQCHCFQITIYTYLPSSSLLDDILWACHAAPTLWAFVCAMEDGKLMQNIRQYVVKYDRLHNVLLLTGYLQNAIGCLRTWLCKCTRLAEQHLLLCICDTLLDTWVAPDATWTNRDKECWKNCQTTLALQHLKQSWWSNCVHVYVCTLQF